MGQSRTFDTKTCDDHRLQSINNDDDEEYVEDNRDEPEAQNLHVVQQREDVPEDDEDLLCIDRENVEVEQPYADGSKARNHTTTSVHKPTKHLESQAEEYDEEYDEEEEENE